MGSELKTTDGVMFDLDIGYSDQFETLVEAYFHNICSGDVIVYKAGDGGLSIFFTKKEDAVKVKLKDDIFDKLKEMLQKFRKEVEATRYAGSYQDPWRGGFNGTYTTSDIYTSNKTNIDPHAWFYQTYNKTPKLTKESLDSVFERQKKKTDKKGK